MARAFREYVILNMPNVPGGKNPVPAKVLEVGGDYGWEIFVQLPGKEENVKRCSIDDIIRSVEPSEILNALDATLDRPGKEPQS